MPTPARRPLPQLGLSLQFSPEARDHRVHLPRHFVSRCLRHALQADAELTVRVVGDAEGRQLNRDFRHKDYATNVLTFDYETAPLILADLVLCAPVVQAEAQAAGVTLGAHYAHLLVHGALHAQGHDHQDEAEAEAMEALEIDILRGLGVANPYGGR